MEINGLCIATITWARNEEEEKVLRDSLQQLSTLNIPVYITDGGSSKNFIQFLNSIPHFKISEAKGLWTQTRMSIKEASKSGVKYIFYTEPDKQEFFSKYLKRMLEEAIANEKTGVVIASRSARGFATYPSFQQMTETTVNNCCKEVIGNIIDYCYGPFLFNAGLIFSLEELDDNIGWGWRPFLFAIANRLRYEIKSFEDDFKCPQHQREDDSTERIYRMKQLTQNINGLIQAATMNLSS